MMKLLIEIRVISRLETFSAKICLFRYIRSRQIVSIPCAEIPYFLFCTLLAILFGFPRLKPSIWLYAILMSFNVWLIFPIWRLLFYQVMKPTIMKDFNL
jgi:hypothetical protein